jgi:hypothetical protein
MYMDYQIIRQQTYMTQCSELKTRLLSSTEIPVAQD